MHRWRDLTPAELSRLQAGIRASARLARGAVSGKAAPGDGAGGERSPQAGPLIAKSGRSGPPQPYERDILKAILQYLRLHPRVAWAQRMNTGMIPINDERMFRAGFVGCSDVIGQMRDGRILCVEVKRPGKRPTAPQQNFLDRVNRDGGLGFVATSVRDCEQALLNTRS